jgi:hypothetical protein
LEASKGWPIFGKLSLVTRCLVAAKATQASQIDSDNISGNREAAKLPKLGPTLELFANETTHEWMGLAATYLVACTITPDVVSVSMPRDSAVSPMST